MKALAAAHGNSSDAATVKSRIAAIAAEHPAFADAYPTLLRMCCEATSDDNQESVRHFLPMMLLQLKQVRRSHGDEAVLHDASVHVGRAVGDRYIPKNLEATSDGLPPAKRQK